MGRHSSSESPWIVAVVLNYCTAAQTLRCVKAIEDSDERAECIIVDNASPDASFQRFKAELPQHTVIQAPRNGGYGAGNNVGIQLALERGADFVWIVTPDVVVTPESLSALIRVMEHDERVGIVGPVFQAGNRTIIGSSVFPQAGFEVRHEFCNARDLATLPEQRATDFVDGGAILLRRAMIEQIGLLREDFFLYYDETEYCLRARDAGWSVMIAGQALVHTRPIDDDRHDRNLYLCRNSILLARVRQEYVWRTTWRQTRLWLLSLVSRPWRFRWRYLARLGWSIIDGLCRPLANPPSAAANRR